MKTCRLKVFRGTPGHQYWEEIELEWTEGMNVISALMEVQKNPKTTPVAWEQGCLEEVCGSCSMLINGKPRQACTRLIEEGETVELAPFTKFPLIKDLVVNRERMFDALKKVKAWISVDGTWDDKSKGHEISPEVQGALYELSTCMTCGCCTESCPQVNEHSEFMGPQVMSQVRLFNGNPVGALEKGDRLRAVLGEEGIAGCGNAQNCVKVCPKKIPLTESIALIGREATKQALKDVFSLPDAKK
jgi:succinate dehydrogenase / fumarate reductase iron-sulfur subunit